MDVIEVHFTEFKSEFEYFEIKRGKWQDEIGERLDIAGKLLFRSIELSTESVMIGNKMLEKQDKSTDEIKGLRQDLKSYMEERFDSIEHEIVIIKEKIGMM